MTLTLTSYAGVDVPNNDLLLKITGSGFVVPVTIQFAKNDGGLTPPVPLAISPENLTATQIRIPMNQIPADATSGAVQVRSGDQTAVSAFSVVPPPIIATSPAQAAAQANITIRGSRFVAGTVVTLPGNLVRGPGSAPPFPAAPFGESLSDDQIVVRVTSNAGVSGRVRVTTPGGTVQSTTILTVN